MCSVNSSTMWIWFLILIALISIAFISIYHNEAVEGLPCNYFDAKNITDGIPQKDGSILFEGIIYPRDKYATVNYALENGETNITVKPYILGCTCNIKHCLRLCCPLGHVRINENGATFCREHDGAKNFEAQVIHENNETISHNLDNYFAYVHGYTCKNINSFMEKKYEITHKGEIQLSAYDNEILTHHEYCLHSELNNETNEVSLHTLVCGSEEPEHNLLLGICMILSVVFILATLFIYIYVPKLRNLQGKCLICYLVTLAMGYTLMAFLNFTYIAIPPIPCKLTGFLMLFSFFSAFFWLNVLNFDLWLNFRSKSHFKQLTERQQFILYLLYGFGIPVILITLVFILDNFMTLPPNLRPGIGDLSCFLDNIFLYFHLPISIVFVINIVFFIMIALQIRKLQNDVIVMGTEEAATTNRTSLRNKREKYILFLRLFFVTGIVWSMEVVSNPKNTFFFIVDICNALQGVLIFIIFVLNRRVFGLVRKRWQNCFGNDEVENDLSNTVVHTNLYSIKSKEFDK